MRECASGGESEKERWRGNMSEGKKRKSVLHVSMICMNEKYSA